MTARRAFSEGLKRMLRAPGLVVAIWAANLIIAMPLGLVLLESIHEFTRDGLYHQKLLEGFDTGWYAEFSTSGSGVETGFSPGRMGIGAWSRNLDRWWDGRVFLERPAVLATGAVFVALWLLLLGGVLEAMREGAPRPRLPAVLADGAARFGSLLRLALITGAAYWLVFRFARWLFPRIHRLTADMTAEKEVLIWNLAGAALIVALVVAVRLISDYAKVALVVERRRSAVLAALRGLRFVASNPVRTTGIACLFGIVMALLFVAYSLWAPGVGDSTAFTILVSAALGQLFVLAKLALRVAFLASQMAFFEVSG